MTIDVICSVCKKPLKTYGISICGSLELQAEDCAWCGEKKYNEVYEEGLKHGKES